jgi:hypothetical protein
MINRMILKLHLPRYIEFILGVLLIIVLISRYSTSPETQNKYVLEYILPYKPLFIIAAIFLFAVAARLIAGPPKDYTRFFYNLLIKLRRHHSKESAIGDTNTLR